MNKQAQKSCFMEFKKQASSIKTEDDLRVLEKQFRRFSECFGVFKPTIDAFFITKHDEFKKARLNALIKPFEHVDALEFNLKGLDDVDKKINAIKDVKTKNAFNGLFNLLSDERNLIYNDLRTRQNVINDLNKFKSLNYFKIAYVSRFDLKKAFRYLSYKNDAKKFYSKLYFIEHGLYVLKTVEHDGLTLKAFYINNKVKNLLESVKIKKALPKDVKFNKSSVDAWKTLDKEDNIRFYAYCNANGLDKENRRLLKSIRQMQGGETFSLRLERVEDALNELEEQYDDLKEITTDNGVILTNYEYLDELDKIRREYWSLTEEHNSDDVPTYIEDY